MDNSTVKPGDIFYSSWGYNQTNITFYQVVKLVGKYSVSICEIASERAEKMVRGLAGAKLPLKDRFQGESFTKRIKNFGNGPCIKVYDFEIASLFGR